MLSHLEDPTGVVVSAMKRTYSEFGTASGHRRVGNQAFLVRSFVPYFRDEEYVLVRQFIRYAGFES